MTAYILSTSNIYHTNSTKDIIGVYTNSAALMRDVKRIIKKQVKSDRNEDKESAEWHVEFLFSKRQTQGWRF